MFQSNISSGYEYQGRLTTLWIRDREDVAINDDCVEWRNAQRSAY